MQNTSNGMVFVYGTDETKRGRKWNVYFACDCVPVSIGPSSEIRSMVHRAQHRTQAIISYRRGYGRIQNR